MIPLVSSFGVITPGRTVLITFSSLYAHLKKSEATDKQFSVRAIMDKTWLRQASLQSSEFKWPDIHNSVNHATELLIHKINWLKGIQVAHHFKCAFGPL